MAPFDVVKCKSDHNGERSHLLRVSKLNHFTSVVFLHWVMEDVGVQVFGYICQNLIDRSYLPLWLYMYTLYSALTYTPDAFCVAQLYQQ